MASTLFPVYIEDNPAYILHFIQAISSSESLYTLKHWDLIRPLRYYTTWRWSVTPLSSYPHTLTSLFTCSRIAVLGFGVSGLTRGRVHEKRSILFPMGPWRRASGRGSWLSTSNTQGRGHTREGSWGTRRPHCGCGGGVCVNKVCVSDLTYVYWLAFSV